MIRYNWQDEFVVSELWPNLVTIHYARRQNQTLVPRETVHFVSRESQEVRGNQN